MSDDSISMGTSVGIDLDLIVLKKWYRPSAWERIQYDDPLDPPPPPPDPTYTVTNNAQGIFHIGTVTVTSASHVTSLPVHIRITCADGTTLLGTRYGNEPATPTTAYAGNNFSSYDNYDYGEAQVQPYSYPRPRNRRERLALAKMGFPLPESIRKIARTIQADSDEEWNTKFWDLILRPKVVKERDIRPRGVTRKGR